MTATADQILDFESQFDTALTQMLAPLLQPYGIALVTFHSNSDAAIPRVQARFMSGTQDVQSGAIHAAASNRTTATAWAGTIAIDLVTRRAAGDDPRPTLGLIRSWFAGKNGLLNNSGLTYLKVVALDEVATNRGTWQEGQEKADISTITYAIIFQVQDAYIATLAT